MLSLTQIQMIVRQLNDRFILPLAMRHLHPDTTEWKKVLINHCSMERQSNVHIHHSIPYMYVNCSILQLISIKIIAPIQEEPLI